MKLNLLWPSWARIVERWPVVFTMESMRRWVMVRRAAVLMVSRIEAEKDSRFARLAWSTGARPLVLPDGLERARRERWTETAAKVQRASFRLLKGGVL